MFERAPNLGGPGPAVAAGATLHGFPSPALQLPTWADSGDTLVQFPSAAPSSVPLDPGAFESDPAPQPDLTGDPFLATTPSPFPKTPRPFPVQQPAAPGGTFAQFPRSTAAEPPPAPSPFPRTPRPFPIAQPPALGPTHQQLPNREPEAATAAEGWAMEPPRPSPPAFPAGDPPAALGPPPPPVQTEVESPRAPWATDEPAPEDLGALLMRAVDQLDLDDHTGALKTVERVLALDPHNATAHALMERCESTLLAMLESKIGDITNRPRVKLKPDEVVWLNLDHRAGFVLSMVDGTVSYDDLFSLSSMSRLETARIIVHLLQARAIG
jgi:hypothetical protein